MNMKHLLQWSLLCIVSCLFLCASASAAEYIRFGEYPQSEAAATPEIVAAAYDEFGDAAVNGVRYRRVPKEGDGWGETYSYYVYEPICWEVIRGEGEIILIAKDILDSGAYDAQELQYLTGGLFPGLAYASAVDYEDSSVCAWLNGEAQTDEWDYYKKGFLDTAFTQEEQEMILGSEDKVFLLAVKQAKKLEETQRQKSVSDYAGAMGAEVTEGEIYAGNGSWLLQDASPIVSSAICTVSESGTINSGISVLVTDTGYGIVPCIRVKEEALTGAFESEKEERILLYYPGGKVTEASGDEAESYLENGWYESEEEAQAALPEEMNSRFVSSGIYGQYAAYVTGMADKNRPLISLEYGKRNASGIVAVQYIRPLVEAFLSGDPSDYMSFSVKFYYSAGMEDSDWLEGVCDAVTTCWTPWSNVVRVEKTTGWSSTGSDSYISFRIDVNGTGDYSAQTANYYHKLREIADAAAAYSDRPLGQIEYIRHYMEENVTYNIKYFSNSPVSVLLNGEGVCGSYANAVKDLCFLLEIPCLVVSNTDANHAWNCVYLEGEWYDFDTTGSYYAPGEENPGDTGYLIGGLFTEHDDAGFPDAARADNVSFLSVSDFGLRQGDDVDPVTMNAIKELFAE